MKNHPVRFNYKIPNVYSLEHVPAFNCSNYCQKVAKDIFKKRYKRGPDENGGNAWIMDDFNKTVWIEGSDIHYLSVLKPGMILIMYNYKSNYNNCIKDEQGNYIIGKGTHMAVVMHIDAHNVCVWHQVNTRIYTSILKEMHPHKFRLVKVIDVPD
jgi:hypothetical protein